MKVTSAHVYIGTSLDGFIARTDGNIDWLLGYGDDDAVEAYKEFIAGIDVIVIGRGTFAKVLEFPDWPYDKPVFVLSGSIKNLPDGLSNKAVVSALTPADLLGHLAEQGFKAAYIDGGKVIQSFLNDDLIDTLTIAKLPVLIGDGIPLFGPLKTDLDLEHLKTKVCTNGLVRSYYKRRRP